MWDLRVSITPADLHYNELVRQDFKDSPELKNPKVKLRRVITVTSWWIIFPAQYLHGSVVSWKAKANVLLQIVKEAQLSGDIATAKDSLLQALALSPGSPQVHKVLQLATLR